MNVSFRARLSFYAAQYIIWLVALFLLTDGLTMGGEWFTSWIKWDALHYDNIWRHGYSERHPMIYAFPPGYSYVVGGLSKLLHLNFHVTAMLLNTVTYFFALVLMVELLVAVTSIQSGMLLFFLSLSTPTGYFILIAYSDMLYMLLLWGVLYLAIIYPNDKRARIAEMCILFISPWIRLTGYALASWLILRRWTALVVFVALAGWLGMNYYLTGNPMHFVEAQKLFVMKEGNFIDGFLYSWRDVFNPPESEAPMRYWRDYLQFHLMPLLYLFALVGVALWFIIRGHSPLIGVTMLAIIALSHNQVFWRSVVRYDMPITPCLFVPLILMAERASSRQISIFCGTIAGSIALVQFFAQGFFARVLHKGWWAF